MCGQWDDADDPRELAGVWSLEGVTALAATMCAGCAALAVLDLEHNKVGASAEAVKALEHANAKRKQRVEVML